MKKIKKWLPVLGSLALLIPGQMITMIVVSCACMLFKDTMSLIVIIICSLITGGIVALPSIYAVSKNVENKRLRIGLYVVFIIIFGVIIMSAFISFNVKR